MCGRVTLTADDVDEVAADLGAEVSPDDAGLYRPRYNAAPSDLCWILEPGADRRVLVPALWGYAVSGRTLINVRGEQVGAGHGFREAFASRRCLVVTDGFFEWTPRPRREPHWYHREDGGLVLLAGLYQAAAPAPAPGRERPRFTILTTRPNKLVAAVHGRMPVVIPRQRIDDWLTAEPARAARLIAPAPDDALVARAVSKRVNSVRNDDPTCLAPPEEGAGTAGQQSLF